MVRTPPIVSEKANMAWKSIKAQAAHRGRGQHEGTPFGLVLRRLGRIASLAWPVALLGSSAVVCIPVALVLGLTAWWLARRDLKQMRAGTMDPAGRLAGV
jgi:hypothetical protein